MSLDFHWYDDAQTIIYYRISGPFEWDVYFHMLDQFNAMMDATTHHAPIYVIGDFSYVDALPPKILQNVDGMQARVHPRLSAVLIVSKMVVIEMAINVIQRTGHPFGNFLMPVSSLTEAEKRIADLRQQDDSR